jgi:hypothetical protein
MATPSRSAILSLAIELCEKDENQGICHACGAIQDCVEPDAEKYQCESCKEWQVFGAEQTLLLLS